MAPLACAVPRLKRTTDRVKECAIVPLGFTRRACQAAKHTRRDNTNPRTPLPRSIPRQKRVNKIREMRDAASIFVDSVINDSTRDLVSISIVPYSEHVSAGPEIMGKFSVNHVHNYSHCLEFDEGDFDRTSMGQWANGSNKTYQQVQHFYWGNSSWKYRDNPVCPQGEHEDVVAFSQDANALKYKISRLVPRGSTSIFAGMKWAAGLLDPSFQSINASLASDGDTNPVFANRPVAFDDNETLKTVVLMTDG
jgi:hypothetical protein